MPDSPFSTTDSTLAHHLAHPKVSPPAHILNKSRERAAFVNARKALYLDTKFWSKLRDASLGSAVEPADPALLDAIRAAVQANKLICPVAADMILELLNVGDQSKRAAAAQLVDDLSLGVTLRTEMERVSAEVEDFIRRRGRSAPMASKKVTPLSTAERITAIIACFSPAGP